jgi:uncharacterized protein YndB with AHSA1/START domain
MAVFRRSQSIARPVEEVFATVVDLERFPEWNPTTRSARRLTPGEIGEGTRFELEIKGFGKTIQELHEFERDHQVRLVPQIKVLAGGHRFRFTREDGGTRIDHELEMVPKGAFKLFSPLIGVIGRKNLRDTAKALQGYLERIRR